MILPVFEEFSDLKQTTHLILMVRNNFFTLIHSTIAGLHFKHFVEATQTEH